MTNANLFRRMSTVEDQMMRHAMPRTSANDPIVTMVAVDRPLGRVLRNVQPVRVLTYKMGDIKVQR